MYPFCIEFIDIPEQARGQNVVALRSMKPTT